MVFFGTDVRKRRSRRIVDALVREPGPVLGLGSAPELAMSNDDVLRRGFELARARGLTDAGAQAITGKGWAESFLGVRTWKGEREGSTQFLLANGEPSYNWGAITARTGQDSFQGSDHDANGKPITQRWARFPSMAAGLDGYLELGSVRAALDALNAGDAIRAAAVLYDRGYFTGTSGTRDDRIRAYAALIKGAAQRVATATGRPLLVHTDGAIPAKGAGAGSSSPKPPPPKPSPASSSSSSTALLALVGGVAVVGTAVYLGRAA